MLQQITFAFHLSNAVSRKQTQILKKKGKKIPRIISTAAEASTENTLLWLCFILKKNRQTRAEDIL